MLLPIAPFTETSGTFVSTEGRVQSFDGVVKPLGETRPAWKVLRVLGNCSASPASITTAARKCGATSWRGRQKLSASSTTACSHRPSLPSQRRSPAGSQRIAEVPIYAADAIVRRAPALQKTRDAAPPAASMNRALFDKLGLRDGDSVRVVQGGGAAIVAARASTTGCRRIASGSLPACPETAALGAMFGAVSAERVAQPQKVAV